MTERRKVDLILSWMTQAWTHSKETINVRLSWQNDVHKVGNNRTIFNHNYIRMTDAFSFLRVATNIPPYTMELVWVGIVTFPLFPRISLKGENSSEKAEWTWCRKSNKVSYPISAHLTLDSTHVPMVIS